jgi:predicted transcriptional regulator
MTIKEIAELCGRAQSTIRNWITSANSAEISAKIADAQQAKKPANFTIEETIAIIRAGKNETLANLLAEGRG